MNNPSIQFPGSVGIQFGKKVYSTMISFKTAELLLEIHPEVQRKLNKSRAKMISTYILKGLNAKNLCFFSAITTTVRGHIDYDEKTNLIDLDYFSRFSVNDGQHRFEGIKIALATARDVVKKAKREDKEEALERLKILENMCIPVVIFDNMTEIHEQQLFHDLNLLASKPTKSVSLKFDNNDLYSLMAKEIKDENDGLIKYGVETERTILSDKHEELMVLSTLRNMISYIISGSANDKHNKLTLENYDEQKQFVHEVFNLIFSALPEDCNDRKKYIIGTAATLQGIGKYVNHIHTTNTESLEEYLVNLGNLEWNHDNPMWDGHGGKYDSEKGKFIFNGTGAGVTGVCDVLIENNKLPIVI